MKTPPLCQTSCRAQSLLSRGHHFQTAINADDSAELLGVRGTPTTLFINKLGKVVLATTTSDPQDPILYKTAAKLVKPQD